MRLPDGSHDRRVAAHNTDTGDLLADRVAVAHNRIDRAVGLLTRAGLDPGEGLWLSPNRGVHTCGMRFPIDVIALDEAGVVVDLVADLKPWRMRLPRPGTAGVLELPAGTIAASATQVGHRISFEVAPDGDSRAS